MQEAGAPHARARCPTLIRLAGALGSSPEGGSCPINEEEPVTSQKGYQPPPPPPPPPPPDDPPPPPPLSEKPDDEDDTGCAATMAAAMPVTAVLTALEKPPLALDQSEP